jgi:ABC-type branched-subunit amino acid transport system substrate-binding protein
MAKGTGENFDGVVTTAPFYYKHYYDKNPMAKHFIDAFKAKYGVPPSNGAENAYVNMFQWKEAVERAGSPEASKVVAKLEGYKFTATKEPNEYWRTWDHQGINSCLVMEGVPASQRGGDVFAFAKVLEVHPGEDISIPQATSKCKIDLTV